MSCRVYPHGLLIRFLSRDRLIHFEKIPVLVFNCLFPLFFYGIAEVEVDCQSRLPDPVTGVASLLGGSRRHIPRDEVSEGRIPSFKKIIPLFFGDPVGGPLIPFVFGDPNPSVVTERLRHERELRLELIELGNACGMDLYEAGVSEERALFVSFPCRTGVGVDCEGRQVVNCAVSARSKHHGMSGMPFNFACYEISCYDPPCPAFNNHQIKHLSPRVHLHGPLFYLTAQRRITAEQALLARLAFCVECSGNLYASE